jgi:hypothetical protein
MGRGVTFVERDLFRSKAFMALRGVAPQMLILFLRKRQFRKISSRSKEKVCIDCDELSLTYVELEKLGTTRPRITRGFTALLAKGFLETKNPGEAYKRDKAIYALSDQWRLWKPGNVMFRRNKSINRGFQGKGRKANQKKPSTVVEIHDRQVVVS